MSDLEDYISERDKREPGFRNKVDEKSESIFSAKTTDRIDSLIFIIMPIVSLWAIAIMTYFFIEV